MTKTILITGGAGFIGSAFTNHIFHKYPNYRILVLDGLTYSGFIENLPIPLCKEPRNERFEFWFGDILNGRLVDNLVAQSNFVIHFAAESHVTRSIYDNKIFFKTDVLGTQVVADSVCKHRDIVERFIHISTSEVYGSALQDYMDEKHPLNPMSPYAAAKVGADRLVYSYYQTYGIPAVILRPFNNYGPRQHLEKVVPRFITSAILNEKLQVHGDGLSSRDFLYVDDTCRAIDKVLHADSELVTGEVFNIGSGKDRTILSIAQDVTGLTKTDERCIIKIDDRPGQVLRHTADSSKIKNMLDWEPTVSWRQGLEKTIKWYRENESWWQKLLWMRQIPIITNSGKSELH